MGATRAVSRNDNRRASASVLALAIALVATALLPAPSQAAVHCSSGNPKIQIDQPVDGDVLKVARVAGVKSGEADTWELKYDAWFCNPTASLRPARRRACHPGPAAHVLSAVSPVRPAVRPVLVARPPCGEQLPALRPRSPRQPLLAHAGQVDRAQGGLGGGRGVQRRLPDPRPAGLRDGRRGDHRLQPGALDNMLRTDTFGAVPGGNLLWIRSGDETILYAHLRQNSIPLRLCPFSEDRKSVV